MEIIRPRLQEIFEEALKAEKLAEEEKVKTQSDDSSLQTDFARLQQMKNETESITSSKKSDNISNNLIAPNGCNPHTTLPPTSNTIPPSLLSDIDTNNSLKSMQNRVGLASTYSDYSKKYDVFNGSTQQPAAPRFFSESGEALRPVHIPERLISEFLNLASQNTRNNLETCGVLAGKLNHNEFTINCLIIPKQVATSDTCAMINEEEIITAQDSLDVMSLGWIHVN